MTSRGQVDALIDLPVSSPVGQLRYRPVRPPADRLEAGLRAVWQKGDTGCLEACIATLLECDLSEVPNPPPVGHLKVEELETQERLHAWVRKRGRRMHYQEIGRQLMNRFWIGIRVGETPGFSHAVLCSARTIVHDPALGVPLPPGLGIEPVAALHYAITLPRLEEDR